MLLSHGEMLGTPYSASLPQLLIRGWRGFLLMGQRYANPSVPSPHGSICDCRLLEWYGGLDLILRAERIFLKMEVSVVTADS